MITTIITMTIVGIFSGLVLWSFKLRHDDRKEVNDKLTQGQINDEVFKQKLADFKDARQEKESEYSTILTEIKSSISSLISEVNGLKVAIAKLAK